MFCKHCGAKISEDSKFCSVCGGNLTDVSETAKPTVEETTITEDIDFETKNFSTFSEKEEAKKEPTFSEENEVEAKSNKKKKRKKTGIILLIIIAVVILLLGTAAFLFIRWMYLHPTAAAVYAYVDEDGYAYVCYDNGKVLKIGSEIEEAVMTPDHKKIVVVEEERIYWTDTKLSKKHVVLEADGENEWLEAELLTDRYLLVSYEKETSDSEVARLYRYEFETKQDLLLLEMDEDNEGDFSGAVNYACLTSDIHYAFATDGEIMLLTADQQKPMTIDNYAKDEKVEMLGVSEDGKIVAWTELKGDQYRLLVWMDGETETVLSGTAPRDEESWGEISFDVPDFAMTSSADGVVVINGSNYSVYIKDGEITKIHFSDEVYAYQTVYSSNGKQLILDSRFAKADGYYVFVENSEQELSRSVYYIRCSDGEKAKLISKVAGFCVTGDLMLYWDKDERLKCGTVDLEQMAMENTASIASDFYAVYNATGNTKYVYYTKQVGETQKFHLYVYDVEKDASEKIASNISGYCKVSFDGNSIYYLTDALEDKETYTTYGTLNVYHAKKGETEKIATDVCSGSLTSGLLTGYIDPDSFFFEKYNGSYKNEDDYSNRIINVCYYNGKKYTTLLKDFHLR